MRYFVTGATGFVGGELARQLVAEGHEVVALVRSPEKAGPLAAAGVTIAPGDITDKASLRAPMSGVDGVFHVAGWYRVGPGPAARATAERINVEGTRNVLEMMAELGIPRGVYTSTVAVFSDTRGRLPDESYRYNGPFINEYERSKWLAHYTVAEPMIRDGLPLTIVLPGMVYGPGDTSMLGATIEDYLRGRLFALPQGTAFCWGHIADTAAGHRLAMERGQAGDSYILAGQVATLFDVLELVEPVTGIAPPRLRPTPALLKGAAALMRLVKPFMPGALPDSYRAESLRTLAGVTYLGSNEKARRKLGFTPRPLIDGLRETVAYDMERLGITRR